MVLTRSSRWWAVALRGIAAIRFGLITFLAPGVSLLAHVWRRAGAKHRQALRGGLPVTGSVSGCSALTGGVAPRSPDSQCSRHGAPRI